MDIIKERLYVPKSKWKLSDEELKKKANEYLDEIDRLKDLVASISMVLGKRPKDVLGVVEKYYRF